MKAKNLRKLGLIALFSACSLYAKASVQAKFSLVPTTPTNLTIPLNRKVVVQYAVTNNTGPTRTLTMVPMPGITQVVDQQGACSNPFTLSNQASCALTLEVDGSLLPAGLNTGPVVCKTMGKGNNSPDPFLCSKPAAADVLTVKIVPPTSPAQKNVYVTNWSANTISLCTENTLNGLLSECNVAAAGGTLANPEAITLNQSATLLYIANIGGSVSFCKIEASTGALNHCVSTGANFQSPTGIAINPAGSMIYVSNATTNAVTRCHIDAVTGELNACLHTGDNFDVPSDLALNPAGTLAYISNFTGDSVTICSIDGLTGMLTCDAPVGGGFHGPEGITLNPSGQFAYISNNGNNTVTRCSVDSVTGTLFGCSETGSTFNGFGSVALNLSGELAYVPSTNSSILVCSVNPVTGALSNCVNSGGTGFTSPSGIAFAP